MNLRPYQEKAVEFLLANDDRAFIEAPAGSGKTIIAAAAHQFIAPKRGPSFRTLWIANTREQVDQAMSALQQFPCDGDVEVQVECAAADPDASGVDLLIVDEAHHLPAESWNRIASRLRPTARIWGFSATPWHDKDEDRNVVLRQRFKNFFAIDPDEVRASGHLAEGEVVFWDVDESGEFNEKIDSIAHPEIDRRLRRISKSHPRFDEFEAKITSEETWRATLPFVQGNPKRNTRIIDLAREEQEAGHSVLVLVASIAHGRLLAGPTGGTLCYSAMGAKKRKAAIEGTRSGDIRCLIATSLADEGMDIPRLSRLILACGGRSSTKLTQRIGRILRPFEGKDTGLCHDFFDRGAALACAQAWARYRKYNELGYPTRIQEHP